MTTNEDMQKALTREIEDWSEKTDPMDFYTVIAMVADAEDDITVFLGTHLYKDLLHATQSNPEKSHEALLKMIELDEKIAALDP